MNHPDRLDTIGIWTEHRPGIPARIGQPALGIEPVIRVTAIIQQPGVTRLRWHRTGDLAIVSGDVA